MKLREWATPLTMGAFAVMGVTGVLMFFHLDSGLNKPAHEWVGWAMILGVAGHVAANWTSVKRYLKTSRMGQGLAAAGIAVLLLSFLPTPGPRNGSPPVQAMRGVLRAPIASVAALTGRPLDQIRADLAKAGVELPNAEASIASVTGEDRGLQARAIDVLFGGDAR